MTIPEAIELVLRLAREAARHMAPPYGDLSPPEVRANERAIDIVESIVLAHYKEDEK